MKKTIILAGVCVLLAGCGQQQISEEYTIDVSDYVNANELVSSIAITGLDENEKAGLILMREEEKLARDVYLYL